VNKSYPGQIINQPRCPSEEEWIKKIYYINTMEFYSAIKKNKIMLFFGNHHVK
jgi:hypothetical protein